MAKITIEDIKKEVESNNWKLLSTSYTNLKTEMNFKCSEGHNIFLTWEKTRGKFVCPVCKNNRYKNIESEVISKKKGDQRVLALDQATKITGYSIFDNKKLIHYGTFETCLEDEIARDSAIKTWLLSTLDNWKPDIVGIEGIQYEEKFGVTTFETLARLQGILLETLYWEKIPYKICPTNTWRAHCGVKGKTRPDKKRSMQTIVKKEYDISVSDDEADAIGIGKYMAETQVKKVQITNWE